MSPPASPTMLKPDQVVNLLQLLCDRQNEEDHYHDMADLRRLMRTALQTRNDAEMIEVLQVGRHEMPEAIKTLQRALEREVEREQDGDGQLVTEEIPVFAEESTTTPGPRITRSGTAGSTSAESQWSKKTQNSTSDSSAKARDSRDTLDREFLESGIDALRRMSRGTELSLPSWTITRYEVDRDEKIGVGFFSDVYKGTWRNTTVAIKVLSPTTPQKLFLHEIQIWKSLVHPNVLELFGASSAVGEPPWFFVSPYLKNGSLVTYLKGLSSLDEVNLLRMIYQVAKGMHYLHDQGVLHGDLKVLVEQFPNLF
jgi:abelson tyrosine-protein kinase 1